MFDGQSISGHVRAELRGEEGQLKQLREIDNVFTDVGDAHVADQLASSQDESAMSHMALGTDTAAHTAGSTALGAELDRNALTSFTQGAGGDDNKVVYVGDWAAGDGTGAVTEAGIFNSSSSGAGTLLCAQTFSVINKGASDTLQITLTSLGSFYRKVEMKLREFGGYLLKQIKETIPSQAEVINSLRACVETRCGATSYEVEGIVRAVWRHTELGRNDLALLWESNNFLGQLRSGDART